MTADNNASPDVDCPNCGLGQNVQDRFGRNDFEIKTTCSHCKKPFLCYAELIYTVHWSPKTKEPKEVKLDQENNNP